MKYGRVPFTSKLRPDMKPEVVPDRKGRGMMLLPTPLLVAQEITAVPEGGLVTVKELRDRLARTHGADLVCPLMTSIFFGIIAGAAEEQMASGQPPVAPYWRVVLDDGVLSPKTPSGPDCQAEHLRREGHALSQLGSKLRVVDYQECLGKVADEAP